MMTDQLMWRTVLAVTLSLGMLPTWSWAAVPVVTDVEVSPSILTQGSGVQAGDRPPCARLIPMGI